LVDLPIVAYLKATSRNLLMRTIAIAPSRGRAATVGDRTGPHQT
jgi:hypothetical protein